MKLPVFKCIAGGIHDEKLVISQALVSIENPVLICRDLKPCYSKRGLWTTGIGITWELVRNGDYQGLSLGLNQNEYFNNKLPSMW